MNVFLLGLVRLIPILRSKTSECLNWFCFMGEDSGFCASFCTSLYSGEWTSRNQKYFSWHPNIESFRVPSGNFSRRYWKWPFIVSFPMQNDDVRELCQFTRGYNRMKRSLHLPTGKAPCSTKNIVTNWWPSIAIWDSLPSVSWGRQKISDGHYIIL